MAKEEDAQRIAKNYIRKLARTIKVRRAILTGSRATGSYLEDSDVDLIIVSDDFSRMPLPDRLRYLQKQWTSRVPLEAFGYTMDEFRMLQRKSSYVKEAIRTGIVLADEREPVNLEIRKARKSFYGAVKGKGHFTSRDEMKAHD